MVKLVFVEDKKKEGIYLKHIHDKFDKNIYSNKISKELDPNCNKLKEYIEINKIKKYWKSIENNFFDIVEDECEYKWKYNKYYAILSKNTAFSFASPFPEFENKVLIDLKCGKIILRIICHELLHQYLNQVIYDELNDERFEDSIIQELFVTHMLFDTRLDKIFDDNYTPKRNMLDANHQKAFEFYKKSKQIWKNKRNLVDYLEKIFSLIHTNLLE